MFGFIKRIFVSPVTYVAINDRGEVEKFETPWEAFVWASTNLKQFSTAVLIDRILTLEANFKRFCEGKKNG